MQNVYLPGWPSVLLSRSPGQPPPTLRSTRRMARPMVALARQPEPKTLAPALSPTSLRTGPFTTSSGAAMWVVACTPCRLNGPLVRASSAARATGAYTGRQPASTRLTASHLARQVAPARRDAGLEAVRVAAQCGDHRVDALRRRRHHRAGRPSTPARSSARPDPPRRAAGRYEPSRLTRWSFRSCPAVQRPPGGFSMGSHVRSHFPKSRKPLPSSASRLRSGAGSSHSPCSSWRRLIVS